MHFAYDLTGDGKTVLKGGWGRFDYIRTIQRDIARLNRNTDAIAVYNWRDLNGDSDYNPGEVNLDPNGPDFVETSATSSTTRRPGPCRTLTRSSRSPTSSRCRSSGRSSSNFAVKVGRRFTRATTTSGATQNNFRPYSAYNIPVTNRDPGPDGEVGNAATTAACSRTTSIRRA